MLWTPPRSADAPGVEILGSCHRKEDYGGEADLKSYIIGSFITSYTDSLLFSISLHTIYNILNFRKFLKLKVNINEETLITSSQPCGMLS